MLHRCYVLLTNQLNKRMSFIYNVKDKTETVFYKTHVRTFSLHIHCILCQSSLYHQSGLTTRKTHSQSKRLTKIIARYDCEMNTFFLPIKQCWYLNGTIHRRKLTDIHSKCIRQYFILIHKKEIYTIQYTGHKCNHSDIHMCKYLIEIM